MGRKHYSSYGQLARQYVHPRNPRTAEQQRNRGNFGAVASRWRALTPEQRTAWCMAAANKFTVTHSGRQVALSGYSYFVSANSRRADLSLPQFGSYTSPTTACRPPARSSSSAPASTLTARPTCRK
jgi:hypothetical protein